MGHPGAGLLVKHSAFIGKQVLVLPKLLDYLGKLLSRAQTSFVVLSMGFFRLLSQCLPRLFGSCDFSTCIRVIG